jgi:hypothetical protein
VQSTNTTANLNAVTGSSGQVWAAGEGGVTVRFNGSSWSVHSTGL